MAKRNNKQAPQYVCGIIYCTAWEQAESWDWDKEGKSRGYQMDDFGNTVHVGMERMIRSLQAIWDAN